MFHWVLPCRSSLSSSLASLLGDTIMSALFTDHATHAAATHMTDPACASDSCDTAAAAAAAAHCARATCESDQAKASSACSTDHVYDTLAPAAMLRDDQPGSAVCASSPDFPALSMHKTSHGPSTGQAPLNESATATPPEDSHSECNVPVKVGIGGHIASAASHPASPESTASQPGVSQLEPGEPPARSAAEPSSLTRADLLPESSGLTTLPPTDAQAGGESAGPSSQANSLFNACSLEQLLATGIGPKNSSAEHAPAEAQGLTAPGAQMSRTDCGVSISSAASVPQLAAPRGLVTAVDCQVTVSETGLDCVAGCSSADPSSKLRASPAATISSAGASPADQSNLTQASPAGSCIVDPSSPVTTAPGATSISAGASAAGCSSPAGSSRSVPASPHDTSSISVRPAADSGSSAGASPAADISPAGASLASSVSPAEASPAVAGTLAVSSPNASSQSGVYTPNDCPLLDSPNLQIAGHADPEHVEVQKGGKNYSAVTAEALFEEMSHASDGSPLALAVLNHSPGTVRTYEHASQQHDSSNLAQQKDNSRGDSVTSRQLGAIHAEMLELLDACGVHESLKELISADAQCFDYSADELLCSMCSNIRTVSCLT